MADVPGIALVGEFFVDPPEDGEASLGLCYVVPRPRRFVTTTTQDFYKPYRYAANNRKQPERSLTTEVQEWVELSSDAVANLKKVLCKCVQLQPCPKKRVPGVVESNRMQRAELRWKMVL